jgi:hypothetical protein
MCRGKQMNRISCASDRSFVPDSGRTPLGRNIDDNIGRAAKEAYSATWSLYTNSAFAVEPRRTMENFALSDRFQDLPDVK